MVKPGNELHKYDKTRLPRFCSGVSVSAAD